MEKCYLLGTISFTCQLENWIAILTCFGFFVVYHQYRIRRLMVLKTPQIVPSRQEGAGKKKKNVIMHINCRSALLHRCQGEAKGNGKGNMCTYIGSNYFFSE